MDILSLCRQRAAAEELEEKRRKSKFDDDDDHHPSYQPPSQKTASTDGQRKSQLGEFLGAGAELIGNVFKKDSSHSSHTASTAVPAPVAEDDDDLYIESVEYPQDLQVLLQLFDCSCKALGELVGEIRNLLPVDEGVQRGGLFVERLLMYGQMRGGNVGYATGHIGRSMVTWFHAQQDAVEELTGFHSDVDGAVQYDMARVQDAVVMLEKSRRNLETATGRFKKLKQQLDPSDKKLSQAESALSGREQSYELNVAAVMLLIPEVCKRMDSVFAKGLAGYLKAQHQIFTLGNEIVSSLRDDTVTLEDSVRRFQGIGTTRLQQQSRTADYQHPLLNILAAPNYCVASVLAESLAESTSDESAEAINALLCLMDDMEMAVPFLKLMISQEISESSIKANSPPVFRNGSTAATRLMNACGQIAGRSYIDNVIGDMLRTITRDIQSTYSRRSSTSEGADFDFLRDSSDALLTAITESASQCPKLLRLLCCYIYDTTGRQELGRCRFAAGGFVMLCLFCPAIADPDLYGIVDGRSLDNTVRKSLRSISRILAFLANGIHVAPHDAVLAKMKPTLEPHLSPYLAFLDTLVEPKNEVDPWVPALDVARRQKDDISLVKKQMQKNVHKIRRLLSRRGCKREILALIAVLEDKPVRPQKQQQHSQSAKNALLCFFVPNGDLNQQDDDAPDNQPAPAISRTVGPPPPLSQILVGMSEFTSNNNNNINRRREHNSLEGSTSSSDVDTSMPRPIIQQQQQPIQQQQQPPKAATGGMFSINNRNMLPPSASNNNSNNNNNNNNNHDQQQVPRAARNSVQFVEPTEPKRVKMARHGVGLTFASQASNGGFAIKRIKPGGPADLCKAFLPGDEVKEINGETVSTMSFREFSKEIMGPEGSEIELTVQRRSEGFLRHVVLRRGPSPGNGEDGSGISEASSDEGVKKLQPQAPISAQSSILSTESSAEWKGVVSEGSSYSEIGRGGVVKNLSELADSEDLSDNDMVQSEASFSSSMPRPVATTTNNNIAEVVRSQLANNNVAAARRSFRDAFGSDGASQQYTDLNGVIKNAENRMRASGREMLMKSETAWARGDQSTARQSFTDASKYLGELDGQDAEDMMLLQQLRSLESKLKQAQNEEQQLAAEWSRSKETGERAMQQARMFMAMRNYTAAKQQALEAKHVYEKAGASGLSMAATTLLDEIESLERLSSSSLSSTLSSSAASSSSERAGLGMTFYTDKHGRFTVKRLIAGGAADRSMAVSPGDVVMSVGGQPTAGMSHKDLARAVVGPSGSTTTLGLLKGGVGNIVEVVLTRIATPKEGDSGGVRREDSVMSEMSSSSIGGEALESSSSMAASSSSSKAGLGMTFVRNKQGQYMVKRLVEGGPAEMSNGLVGPGDIIVSIDGISTLEISQKDLARAIVGPEGSIAHLQTIKSGTSVVQSVNLTRSKSGVKREDSIMSEASSSSIGYAPPPSSSSSSASASLPSSTAAPGISSSSSSTKAGLGMTFRVDSKGRYVVKRLVDGGPAESSGGLINVGDVLISVDGIPTEKMSQKDIARAVVGVTGSIASLTVLRGSELRSVQLMRAPSNTSGIRKEDSVMSVSSELSSASIGSTYSSASDWTEAARETSRSSTVSTTTSSSSSSSSKVGVGMTFKTDKQGRYVIKRLVEGGAAEMNGRVQPGDIMIQIAGVPTMGMSKNELAKAVMGPVGSEVSIVLQKMDGQLQTVTLTRIASRASTTNDDAEDMPPSSASYVPPPFPQQQPQPAPPQAPPAPPQALPSSSSSSSSTKSKVGLGMTFKTDKMGRYVIKRLVGGGPAERSGAIAVGDILVSIGNAPTQMMSKNDLAKAVMGPPGSTVELMVQQQSGPQRLVTLTRISYDDDAASAYTSSDAESVTSRGSTDSVEVKFEGGSRLSSSSYYSSGGDSDDSTTPSRDVRGKVGLGMTFKVGKDGRYSVKRITSGGPAERSGRVHAGDVMVSIGGISTSAMSQKDLARAVLGPANSCVEIGIERNGRMEMVMLTRGNA